MRVLVLRSADADFFLAHYDVAAIASAVGEPMPARNTGETKHGFHVMRVKTMNSALKTRKCALENEDLCIKNKELCT